MIVLESRFRGEIDDRKRGEGVKNGRNVGCARACRYTVGGNTRASLGRQVEERRRRLDMDLIISGSLTIRGALDGIRASSSSRSAASRLREDYRVHPRSLQGS